MVSAAPALDFEALLSRGYRPATVTRIVPRDKYQPETENETKKKRNKLLLKQGHITNADKDGSSDDNGDSINSIRNRYQETEETSRLVLQLVKQTPAFRRHLPEEAKKNEASSVQDILSRYGGGAESIRRRSGIHSFDHYFADSYDDTNHVSTNGTTLPASKFHDIELGDWESQINWKGCATPSDNEDENDKTANDDEHSDSNINDNSFRTASSNTKMDQKGTRLNKQNANKDGEIHHRGDSLAKQLLERPRNHFLDSLVFDHTTVSWTGDAFDLLEKAMKVPLTLELGVAGRSVGRHVYQNSVLSAQRPTPALKSDAYQNRVEREWAKQPPAVVSAEDVAAKGSLHQDKEKMQALIEARQKKRAQMAEDKKDRVADAMGTMALGGGRGRTVTSSLMGPGGTERTGRPSRSMAVGGAHEAVYIEQLDMVVNHTLYRDLSKVMLRQYLRPKLPLSVVRQGFLWQFQYRYIHANKGGPNSNPNGTGAGGTSSHGGGAGSSSQHQQASATSSYMMSSSSSGNIVPGAISKERLRTEADLSPTEGRLILLEYCEERPPIQMIKGMCSKIVNYYRGDKARCPVSAGMFYYPFK